MRERDEAHYMPSPAAPRLRLRRRTAAVVAIATALALLTACLNTEQSAVLSRLNQDRNAHGLVSLGTHGQAQQKAQRWAEELARTGTLKHSKLSDGISGCWRSIGENVGRGPNVASIQNAYMNSAGHRANILSNTWNGVGVGYAKRGSTTYTVQVFIKAC